MLTFINKGEIDMLAATTLGINAKENDSPIGYFGTGLKYAIAGVLRLGGRIEIWSGGNCHHFEARPAEVRGKEFHIVHMDGRPLGFTTALGRNWRPWMLYREMASNVMDEGGDIQSMAGKRSPTFNLPGTTSVVVHCEEVEAAHRERGRVFLSPQREVLWEGSKMRVLDGGAESVFYRGIRAHDMSRPSLLTYDITERTELTEDRTIAWSFLPVWHLTREVLAMTDADLIRRILTTGPGYWEHGLDFDVSDSASENFMEVARSLKATAFELCPPTLDGYLRRAPLPESSVEIVHPTDGQEAIVARACKALCEIGLETKRSNVLVARSLGSDQLVSAKNDAVLIAEEAIEAGARALTEAMAVHLLIVGWGDKGALSRAVKIALDIYQEHVIEAAL